MAGFFPLFFKQFWCAGLDVNTSSYYLGMSHSIEGLIVVLLAPFFGAMADAGKNLKKFLLFFCVIGSCATASLYFIPSGQWLNAVILYAIAAFGFSVANIFYDALILNVARAEQLDRVSSLGYALGYLGGGLLFLLNVLMYTKPEWFGLTSPAQAILWSFVTVGLWWILFSLPLAFFVNEATPTLQTKGLHSSIRYAFNEFTQTFTKIRALKPAFLFLLAYLFYIDGVNTIIKMAVDYGLSIGLAAPDLIKALLLVQFVGFPAAIVFGYFGERWGAVRGILLCIIIYLFITVYAYSMTTATEFYFLAAAIGLVQGGLQALSRSHFARLIPKDKAAEFFGFFNVLGKFSAILGPWLVGWISVATQNSRLAILVIAGQLVIGALLLLRAKSVEASQVQ